MEINNNTSNHLILNHLNGQPKSTDGFRSFLWPIMLAVIVIALFLHITVLYTTIRARLNENHYYLVRIISIADTLNVLSMIPITVPFIDHMDTETHIRFTRIINLLAYIFACWSLCINIIIAGDRWIAVYFPLHYIIWINKRKLNTAVLSTLTILAIILYFLFYAFSNKNPTGHKQITTTPHAFYFITSLRGVTSILILLLGLLTVRHRAENERRIRKITNLHGQNAEKLTVMRKMKSTVKDVLKLNIWTCLLIMPNVIIPIFIVTGLLPAKIGFGLTVLCTMIYVISNPIIYLTCFTKIRRYWCPPQRINNRNAIELQSVPNRANQKQSPQEQPPNVSGISSDRNEIELQSARKQPNQKQNPQEQFHHLTSVSSGRDAIELRIVRVQIHAKNTTESQEHQFESTQKDGSEELSSVATVKL